MTTSPRRFTLLLLADTHLGFDRPVRPRVDRRRRGPDFRANLLRVFDAAVTERADLVVHGGDLFFRARIPAAIVDEVYGDLLDFARHGIPLAIVPGNHERSLLPDSLFLQHPGIHVFRGPATLRFELGGARVALTGFPNVRKNVRDGFRDLVAAARDDAPADVRLLCLHQTVEGATVGPGDFVFRGGHDVIRRRDLPRDVHAVLAGHIHRHQVLRPAPGDDHPPVVYPGSIERTSFAEADEPKGYCRLVFAEGPGGWAIDALEFVPLPARPMLTIDVPADLAPADAPGFLDALARDLPSDAVVRLRAGDGVPDAVRRRFGELKPAERLPRTMNVQFASAFFGDRPRRRRR